jgi:hypothetical protein
MRATKVAAVLAALVLVGTARAQTYTIKFKKSDVGKGVLHTGTDKTVGLVEFTGPDGTVLDRNKLNETTEEVFTETVLEKGDAGPKKYKRAYKKVTLPGGRVAPYQGKTVVFEKKGDKYQARVEGDAEVPAKDLERLTRRANTRSDQALERAYLPGKPVKVGDSWMLDIKALAASVGDTWDFDPAKSAGTGKLVRVYKQGDKRHGVLLLKFRLVTKRIGELPVPATVDGEVTLDTAIDGSSTARTETFTAKIRARGEIDAGGRKVTVKVDLDGSGKDDRSEEK